MAFAGIAFSSIGIIIGIANLSSILSAAPLVRFNLFLISIFVFLFFVCSSFGFRCVLCGKFFISFLKLTG